MIYKITTFLIILIISCNTLSLAEENERNVLSHRLDIAVDIEGRKIMGTDLISISDEAQGLLRLIIRKDSDIYKIEMNDISLDFSINVIEQETGKEVLIQLPPYEDANKDRSSRTLLITFRCAFPDIGEARKDIKRGVSFVSEGVIGEEGAFLPASSVWHPQEAFGLAEYEVNVTIPAGFESIMEGSWLNRSEEGGKITSTWDNGMPLEGINLVVGKYIIEKEHYKGVDIYTFFFNKDDKLSSLYIEKTKWYMDIYRGIFPQYPFKKFAIVESFLPTGYSMPSYTLLGSSILRLPFIPDTSLGHEIVHNWWGNAVFLDQSLGNWVEAITTYTADHFYAEQKSEEEAKRYRKKMLVAYRSYAGEEVGPLKDIVDNTQPSSRVVVYNKGSMVFHMLRRLLGDDIFYSALKGLYKENAFKEASWADVELAFERSAKMGLRWFFNQWLTSSSGPVISIEDIEIEKYGNQYHISFEILQKGQYHTLKLPVLIKTEDGEEVWRGIWLAEGKRHVEFVVESRPVSLEIDPGYDNFRVLSYEEVPPSLAGFLGDKDGIIVTSSNGDVKKKYWPMLQEVSRDFGMKSIEDTEAETMDVREQAMLIVGGPGENQYFDIISNNLPKGVEVETGSVSIMGNQYNLSESVIVLAIKNPYNPEKTILIIMGSLGKKEIAKIGKRLPHLASKSYLVFTKMGGLESGIFEGENALRRDFDLKGEIPLSVNYESGITNEELWTGKE